MQGYFTWSILKFCKHYLTLFEMKKSFSTFWRKEDKQHYNPNTVTGLSVDVCSSRVHELYSTINDGKDDCNVHVFLSIYLLMR